MLGKLIKINNQMWIIGTFQIMMSMFGAEKISVEASMLTSKLLTYFSLKFMC